MSLGIPALIAGPAYMSNTVTNIYTPPASPIGTIITQIHIASAITTAGTFSLWVGNSSSTTGGTQIEFNYPLTGGTGIDYDKTFYPGIPLTSTQFLVGQASTVSAMVITVMGFQRVIG